MPDSAGIAAVIAIAGNTAADKIPRYRRAACFHTATGASAGNKQSTAAAPRTNQCADECIACGADRKLVQDDGNADHGRQEQRMRREPSRLQADVGRVGVIARLRQTREQYTKYDIGDQTPKNRMLEFAKLEGRTPLQILARRTGKEPYAARLPGLARCR